jgi:AraC-like DNA-binding protein
LKGRGELKYKGDIFPVRPGEAMLLTVPEEHCYYFPSDSESWEFIFITMYGREVMRIFHELRQKTGAIAKFSKDSIPVNKAFSICEKTENDDIRNQYEASAMAYDFLMSMVDYIYPAGQGGRGRPEFIDRVYDYCMVHIGDTVKVDDMARCAGYSRYHFTRLFKHYMGVSPQNFMRDIRIRVAVRLLQTEQLSVKEVATRCGFEDVSYFCKIFRKYQNVSPNEFRGM